MLEIILERPSVWFQTVKMKFWNWADFFTKRPPSFVFRVKKCVSGPFFMLIPNIVFIPSAIATLIDKSVIFGAKTDIFAILDHEPGKKESWERNSMLHFVLPDKFYRSEVVNVLVLLGFLIDFFGHQDYR